MRLRLNVRAKLIRKGVCIRDELFHNGIVDEGKTLLLDTMFGEVAKSYWYIGLINDDSYTNVDPLDVMDDHAGWVEWTDYDEASRMEWIVDDAADKEIWTLPASPAIFTMSAAGTLKGIFISTDDTKGGTTGYLWATALFSEDSTLHEDWDVEIDDEVHISYGVIIE
jgi:hypothetical protein